MSPVRGGITYPGARALGGMAPTRFLFPFPCLPGEKGRVLRTHGCHRGPCYPARYCGLTYAVNFS